jgi:hypothetical protein
MTALTLPRPAAVCALSLGGFLALLAAVLLLLWTGKPC